MEELQTSYWYCPVCDAEIDDRNVTFDENHDLCGSKVKCITNKEADDDSWGNLEIV